MGRRWSTIAADIVAGTATTGVSTVGTAATGMTTTIKEANATPASLSGRRQDQ
jgi:hypothetical protein